MEIEKGVRKKVFFSTPNKLFIFCFWHSIDNTIASVLNEECNETKQLKGKKCVDENWMNPNWFDNENQFNIDDAGSEQEVFFIIFPFSFTVFVW